MSLEIKKSFTKSATSFAVNFEECIAIASGKKIQFFGINPDISDFAPVTLGKSSEQTLSEQVEKISKIQIISNKE